jgi:hypothetical protein
MTQLESSILLSMMITISFLVSSFTFLVSIATPANLIDELFLPHIPVIFADHGQEISLILNSGHFVPLTIDDGNQVGVSVNYTTNNSTIIDNTINAAMKVYAPNRTAIKSTSFPNGFIANNSGVQEIKTTIRDNQTKNITAVVQFTDATKTIPISNPVQIRLNLTQPTTSISEETTRPEIAAFPP